MNRVELSARLEQCDVLRHTPAGVPIVQVELSHESEVLEAGLTRSVHMHFSAMALGETARTLAGWAPGQAFDLRGFLAPKRRGSDWLVLHIQDVTRHI